jgi:hypothetical protein
MVRPGDTSRRTDRAFATGREGVHRLLLGTGIAAANRACCDGSPGRKGVRSRGVPYTHPGSSR